MRNDLESIVQTKINSFGLQNSVSKETPKPAPRRASPKKEHAPPIPNHNISSSKAVDGTTKEDENTQSINSTKTKFAEPKSRQFGNQISAKKGKANIKISNFESSVTDYSTLERK